jgi:hypothetical protein
MVTAAAATNDATAIVVAWHPAFRIIPSRFPSVTIFDRVASPEDFDALYALEAMTNDRVRDEVGDLKLVPPDQRIFGPGSGPIMAAFTHRNPDGSRFSDGLYGVFYAAQERRTAIAETQYHSANFLRATKQEPIRLEMRVYHVEVHGQFDDVQTLAVDDPILDKHAYGPAQVLARRLRARGASGIHYRSVRDPAGLCIAAFKTDVLSNCRHASQLLYQWDGTSIAAVYEKLD